jgi:hypothetical protein
MDTTQATAANRVKMYFNGVQQTVSAVSGYNLPAQNFDTDVNSTFPQAIGVFNFNSTAYFNGYMTEIYMIDGQALTPSSFGQNDPNTGVWSPIKYTGTYGTNGFYLNFSDNSGTTSTTLGKDYSGNGNNWTPNNFSVTAGSGNDSLVDSPTSYGTDTGIGGEVRGNYCTWNPLDNSISTLNNGNLSQSSNYANSQWCRGTIELVTGKWYWEGTLTASNGDGSGTLIGICNSVPLTTAGNHTAIGNNAIQYFGGSGDKRVYGTTTTYGSSYTTNDVIGVAVDKAAGTIQFFKNNVSQGVITDSRITSDSVFPLTGNNSTSGSKDWSFNFGQRAFAYTAPSGFKALCTQNLPTPTIGATSTTQANDYFDVSLWTGNGTSQTITNSGSMQPDFVWYKRRSTAAQNGLMDSVRGATKYLSSDTTDAESTVNGVTSFNANGFTVGDAAGANSSGDTFVGWQWRASNAAGVTNTAGTITSTVSASTTSGFSIVTFTGTGANATVGHGLGVAPSMYIVKNRPFGGSWGVYHTSIGATNRLLLNGTNASTADSGFWNNTAPTSTVFSVGNDGAINRSGDSHVAYCFAPVAGYSAFGSYTGNGSADGPFVYTGFRPRYVLIKLSSNAGEGWVLNDTSRSPYNVCAAQLLANSSGAEVSGDANTYIDILSNGFKIRTTAGTHNTSGYTYIYAAFAESPFKYSLAR